MYKIIFFTFYSISIFAQSPKVFLPESSDLVMKIKNNEIDNLKRSLEADAHIISKFTILFGKYFDFENQYEMLQTKNVDEWEMNLYDVREKQITFLNKNKDSLSVYNFNFISSEVQYNYWHLLIAYPVIRSNKDTKVKRVVSLPKIMTKNFILNSDDSLLISKSYRALLPFYNIYKNSEEKDFVKYADMVQSTVDKSEYALKNLKGLPLDYTLANLLQNNITGLTTSSARYIMSQINNADLQKEFTGEYFYKLERLESERAVAAEENKKKESKSKDGIQLVDLAGKTFDFSKYKGKVIYVDFWASWCGPCRAEFPFSKKMHGSLSEKDRAKIVFLYISIDDKEEAWKSAIERLQLGDFENGFSPGGWSSEVVQKFRITGIPRYMIINKNGEIVSKNAKRPSNPETLDDLLKLAN